MKLILFFLLFTMANNKKTMLYPKDENGKTLLDVIFVDLKIKPTNEFGQEFTSAIYHDRSENKQSLRVELIFGKKKK